MKGQNALRTAMIKIIFQLSWKLIWNYNPNSNNQFTHGFESMDKFHIQRCFLNPVKHLRWIFLWKESAASCWQGFEYISRLYIHLFGTASVLVTNFYLTLLAVFFIFRLFLVKWNLYLKLVITLVFENVEMLGIIFKYNQR